ncbi:conserved protein of unknown function [Candidatus Promineifilum breve]|uniref:Uncharacterized protein n=1 Tax=Candidatus Promineifilum breve TaxID=1806508 RepID=A0A160T2Q1_9CHLR|nr:hypothetical protein [Candidatus Promineifilum breve]CUS03984.2 conserved protein of unknown function [Candidatus Promineifilum breve]
MIFSSITIGEIIHNGLVFDFKNWNQPSMNEDDLRTTVARLFSLLDERRVDYVLVGGVALLQYVAGRNTQDIDLIIALSSLQQLPEIRITQSDEYFARGEFDGLQIDMLLTRNPLFAYVQKAHATPRSFAESTITTATVEGLVLLKLYALPSLYRQGDFVKVGIYENDVATLLRAYQPDVAGILTELELFISDTDLHEIREIVRDLQARFSRFDSSGKESSTNGGNEQ